MGHQFLITGGCDDQMGMGGAEGVKVNLHYLENLLNDPEAGVLLPAAVIGAMAYGTYEFTSYAIMKDWHWQMVMTDTIWGTVLTGLSAWAGVAITRALFGAVSG